MFAAASLVALALAALPTANAFWRVACDGNALVRERADPIVSAGKAANHMHVIHGGNAFNLNYTFEDARASTCSTCQVYSDLSNYWTPALMFHDKAAGTFEPVPNGGLLVYYQQRGDDKPNIKAFPPGFRMIAGDMKRRAKLFDQEEGSQAELQERATKWACLRYGTAPGYDDYGFPTTRCESGFQARLHMPNCWDGVNVDSSDHRSHTAYMSRLDNGKCPDTHPVSLMTLFYEVTWDISAFDDRYNPDAGDEWPFVYANGDPTGHGWHGDFVNGWNVDVLQQAITGCDNNTPGTAAGNARECPFFEMQTPEKAGECSLKPHFEEQYTGVMSRLPGCNPIQAGPEAATPYSTDNCPLDGAAPPTLPEPTTTESEPTPTPDPVEPTTSAPEPTPTTSDEPAVPEPTTTSAPDVPEPEPSAPATQTVTVTVTVTAAPICTGAPTESRFHHRRSMVPTHFERGRAPTKYVPRRRAARA